MASWKGHAEGQTYFAETRVSRQAVAETPESLHRQPVAPTRLPVARTIEPHGLKKNIQVSTRKDRLGVSVSF